MTGNKEGTLIVGQGLAGTCLAMELIRRNIKVTVADKPDPNAASRVAAGMFNPITSKLRTSTWNAKQLFPALDECYRYAEALLETSFYHPMVMYRPFTSVEDQNGWSVEENPFIRRLHFSPAWNDQVNDPLGGIEINHSGYVDTRRFTEAFRSFLMARNAWMEIGGGHDEVMAVAGQYNKVIWCEGAAVTDNPLFRWLPISKLKGEVLELQTQLRSDILFNGPAWLVPGDQPGQFRAGSTYDRSGLPGNTTEGTADLTERLSALLKPSFRVIGSDWGFRPVVRDRRPVMGPHPERENHYVFNGLGTKGVSLAPWCAARFADFLTGTGSLPGELNISRFSTFYFKYLQDTPR